jgi:hypothetical protein
MAIQRHVSILDIFDKPFSAVLLTVCLRDISHLAGKMGHLAVPPM